jgi:hypothetical protein
VFLLSARQFADENVVRVDGIDADAAEVAQEVTPGLPVPGQTARLDVPEDQAELVLDFLQQSVLWDPDDGCLPVKCCDAGVTW